MKTMLIAYLVFTGVMIGAGCQGVPNCGDLDALTEDVDGDGLLDVAPPGGVVFDPANSVGVLAINTLVPADLLPHIEEANLSPFVANTLLDLTDFFVTFSFNVSYDDGVAQTICQTKPFAPFDIAFEVACPVDAELAVEATAVLPIFGGILIRTIPIGLTLDVVDFECGKTVEFVTTTENGEVIETVDVF